MEMALSMGTNMGERLANLRSARNRIAAHKLFKILAQSCVYETEPVDVLSKHRDKPFLNAVLVVDCALDVNEASDFLHEIEAEMGRVRTRDPNAPRPIDIDILYAGDLVLDRPELTLPHPRWASRRFVLAPLADVRPERRLPGVKQTVREMLFALKDNHNAIVFRHEW